MKICFYARAGQTTLFAHMSLYLKQKSIGSCFVTNNAYETKILRGIVSDAVIYEIAEFLKSNWDDFKEVELIEYQKKYSEKNLWELFYTDRFLINYEYVDSIKFLIGHLKFYEMVYENEYPDVFYNEAISLYSSYAAYIVGLHYNVMYIGFSIARDYADSKMFLHLDPYQTNHRLKELFYSNYHLSENDINEVEKHIDKAKQTYNIPNYMKKHLNKPKFKLKYLLYPFKYLLLMLEPKYKNKYDYTNYKVNFLWLQPIVDYLRYLMSREYYCEPKLNDKFYLFPLHYQPEASTLICAPKYEKQLFAIDQLAKSLPSDSLLYVKEHYAFVGHRKLSFYKELTRYPNVKLINPYYPITHLIRNACAIVVLTSTTGFEGLLYKKPVFVLGNVFYDFLPGVQKISDIWNEKDKFYNLETVSHENLIRFIYCYLKSLYTGCAHADLENYYSQSNIEALCISLIEEAKRNGICGD